MSIHLKIGVMDVPVKFWTFPGGERNVRIEPDYYYSNKVSATITCLYKGSDDLVDLILLTNALRYSHGSIEIRLNIPYFPFARQDRVMVDGEAHALQAIVQVINMLDFSEVYCLDAHSDVLAALFPPGKLRATDQWDIWSKLKSVGQTGVLNALVSPDAGALKKIYKLAKVLEWPVIEASKHRDVRTGEITGVSIDSASVQMYKSLYIVDDICDGGRTFIELANTIFKAGFKGKLNLCVTHGIFSKGLAPLDMFCKIYCENNINNIDLYTFNNRER